ncbi:unnamed protein product [Aphis gossypii]|uniref:Uncharacterized protein n=1 Tax=Aphis gossypii TaxID=80765 RepID=A0A9P0NI25_APHGO|nr:unnamed protein product [Aphis gossypii]
MQVSMNALQRRIGFVLVQVRSTVTVQKPASAMFIVIRISILRSFEVLKVWSSGRQCRADRGGDQRYRRERQQNQSVQRRHVGKRLVGMIAVRWLLNRRRASRFCERACGGHPETCESDFHSVSAVRFEGIRNCCFRNRGRTK